MQKEIKKRARLYGVAAILLAVILVSVCYQLGYIPQMQLPQTNSFMSTFSSYEQLRDFLKTNSKTQYGYPTSTKGGDVFINGVPQFNNVLPPAAISQNGEATYSTTNVQVAGVDEADIVKNDGEYIYLLTGTKISILRAYPPSEAQLLSTIAFNDMTPSGIFVNHDTLAVLGVNYSTTQPQVLLPQVPPTYSTVTYIEEATTYLRIYDISNRTDPELLKTFTTSGDHLGSRMIGDYVYLIAGQPAYYSFEVFPSITVDKVNLPTIEVNGTKKEVSASEVYYSNATDDYFMFTTIAALNIKNTTEDATSKTLMIGGSSTLYASLTDVYLTYTEYDSYEQTSIYRIHVENSTITPEAAGKVPGHILNQFSMDQYGDYFRVATTTWNIGPMISTPPNSNTTIKRMGEHGSNVYVLDMNLSIVGSLEGLAPGENFHSARFMGNKCYLVTFMSTDPLFVIDLTSPAKPTELGNLTIPGYSDYLHPYDENHLIGVGKEASPAEEGYFAWYQGVKISLFDVSNVSNPIQMANYTIGDRGTTSPVLDDHRAFLFDKSQDLLVIPVLEAKVDQSQYPPGQVPASAYGQPIWQGAYVFNLTLNEGFFLKGKISHLENGIDIWNSTYYIQRSLYIEDVLYTISDAKVKLNSLEDLAFIKEIKIN
jgi:inhibitor of cysteine peptidase